MDDDPEFWAAMAASLSDGGGFGSPPRDTTTLKRHLSGFDPSLSQQLRARKLQSRWKSDSTGIVHFGGKNPGLGTSDAAMILPSFAGQPPAAQHHVLSQVMDDVLSREAEREGIINADPLSSWFVVLSTLGDGNCLLHAASMGLWGVQDQDNVLREALVESMESKLVQQEVRQRFFHQLSKSGLPPESLEREWLSEVQAPAKENRDLTDVHIFVLANILRRPIIVYGSCQAAMAGLVGIYLPILARKHGTSCWQQPLTLLFSHSHFSLLGVMSGGGVLVKSPVVPLSTGKDEPVPLPIGLLTAEEEIEVAASPLPMLVAYMKCIELGNGLLGVRLESTSTDILRSKLLEQAASMALGS